MCVKYQIILGSHWNHVFFHIRPFTRRWNRLQQPPRDPKRDKDSKKRKRNHKFGCVEINPVKICGFLDIYAWMTTLVWLFQREQGCPSYYWSNERQIYDKSSFILASPLPDFKGLAHSCIDENVSVLQRAAILTEQWRLTERCQRSKADKSITVANYKYGWTIFCARTDI